MNSLAIFALASLTLLAFFGGVALALLATAAFLLYRAAQTQRELSLIEAKRLGDIAQEMIQSENSLRAEVTSALTRVDAQRMYESSLLIQRTERQFDRSVRQLMKLLYSQEGAAAIAAEEAEEESAAGVAGIDSEPTTARFNPQAYSDHLRQRAAERAAAEQLSSALHRPPLDPEEAWRMQEEEEEAGGPLA